MDSNETNRPLTEAPVPEVSGTVVPTSAVQEETNVAYTPKQTKGEVIDRLIEIDQDACNADKQELDVLKQTFYKLHKAEQEAARKSFLEEGGSPEAFVLPEDDAERRFKAVMSSIKEKRTAMAAEQEKEREENLQKKLAIIEKLKALAESSEDANKAYTEYKALQTEWNEIRNVPATKVNELWKNYQLYAEKFYDLIKLNNEFREYDFKKNLELKTRLCEAAERLAAADDVVSAFHQLQKLHQEFRDTGPVAKELREEVWTRFKAASTVINRRHQQHFEELKEREQRNLDEKIVICEIVESMECDTLATFQDWDNKTQEILSLQARWKTIGRAPQRMNQKIFERFRAACDNFFGRKAEFFKKQKDRMSENLDKKKELCAKAEALKDSTDWKATTEALQKLQKEWKTVGSVSKKHSDAVWKRFINACDYFFDQKAKATSSQHSVERENLEAKKAVIAKLKAIDDRETSDEDAAAVRDLMKEWNAIGHVPYKDKDKLYKQYRTLVDNLFDKLNLSASQKRLNTFKAALSGKEGNFYREREKLLRAYENMKSEIQTYENNLGFLTSSSKKGSSLLTEMNRKVEKLKAELQEILKKIELLDQSAAKED